MVTSSALRPHTASLLVLAFALVPACAPVIQSGDPGESEVEDTPKTPGKDPAAWSGRGFVVHEWGTDTVVVGSNGSLQRGLHHEEEDLPSFVYDRLRAGALTDSTSVQVKMETPVTYFYSDKPLTATVSVAFPLGVFTQWYPAVQSFYPFVAAPNAVLGQDQWSDPALDVDFPFQSQLCADKHGQVANGLLDWGKVEVLARGAAAALPEAPLDAFTWSHARAVDANLVRIAGAPTSSGASEAERFLFYRGLGNFKMPALVTAAESGALAVENSLGDPLGPLFVVNVGATQAAFVAYPDGILPGHSLSAVAPALSEGLALDAFAEALGEEVNRALEGQGLYHDEAAAMVATWKRQWFRTPGLRVFYLAPQTWTDSSIPLSVTPTPESMTRVMMIRVEVITPELELADVEAAKGFADPAKEAAATAFFKALGRFAEPRLRRALELLGNPVWGEKALVPITSVETRGTVGE